MQIIIHCNGHILDEDESLEMWSRHYCKKFNKPSQFDVQANLNFLVHNIIFELWFVLEDILTFIIVIA